MLSLSLFKVILKTLDLRGEDAMKSLTQNHQNHRLAKQKTREVLGVEELGEAEVTAIAAAEVPREYEGLNELMLVRVKRAVRKK